MLGEAVEPFELGLKFRARLRIAVREADRGDRDAPTAASLYLLYRSSISPCSMSRIRTGSRFRARMATPFQDRSPLQTA
jgi:hypothetical protein